MKLKMYLILVAFTLMLGCGLKGVGVDIGGTNKYQAMEAAQQENNKALF